MLLFYTIFWYLCHYR